MPVAIYPSPIDATTVKATSYYDASSQPHFGADPSVSLIGGYANNSWYAGATANQKFNIAYTEEFKITEIRLNNSHHNGGYTTRGIKDFVIYGTNAVVAFNNTTFSNTDNLTVIGSYSAREHVSSNVADTEIIAVNASEAFQYYILRIVDNHGDGSLMGIRHIELWGSNEIKAGLKVSCSLMHSNEAIFDLQYRGLSTPGSAVLALWAGLPTNRAGLQALYQECFVNVQTLAAVYSSAPMRAAGIIAEYNLNAGLSAGITAEYPLLEGMRAAGVIAVYELMLREPLVAATVAQWATLSNSANIRDYGGLYVIIDNAVLLSWTALTITEAEGSTVIEAVLALASRAEYKQIQRLQQVQIFDGSTVYNLIVDEMSDNASRSSATEYEEIYSITCRSVLAMSSEPYALRQDFDFQDSALVSDIFQELADVDGIAIDWQCIDWRLPGKIFSAENSTPSEAMGNLIANIAIIQSQPDGTVEIREKRPQSWDDIEISSPLYSLDAAKENYQYSLAPDNSERFNKIKISDGIDSERQITLETVAEQPGTDLIKIFSVPFTAGLVLHHSGGAGVLLEDMGNHTEEIEQEIEFIDGKSSVSNPIYSAISAEYMEDDLGAITATEGGLLSVAGGNGANSLAKVTYLTKWQQWRIKYDKNNRVQIWIEDIE